MVSACDAVLVPLVLLPLYSLLEFMIAMLEYDEDKKRAAANVGLVSALAWLFFAAGMALLATYGGGVCNG